MGPRGGSMDGGEDLAGPLGWILAVEKAGETCHVGLPLLRCHGQGAVECVGEVSA
jgi:hypothetical protein